MRNTRCGVQWSVVPAHVACRIASWAGPARGGYIAMKERCNLLFGLELVKALTQCWSQSGFCMRRPIQKADRSFRTTCCLPDVHNTT